MLNYPNWPARALLNCMQSPSSRCSSISDPNKRAGTAALAEHVLAMMHGTPPEGAAAALRDRAERPDYTELLAGISVPALVVGQDDEFTRSATPS
jgi:hypothetical protein